jgi:hypothetical protein
MNFTRLEWEIMAAACEDAYALWDLLGDARNVLGSKDSAYLIRETRKVIETLLERRLVSAFWFRHEDNSELDIPPDEARQILARDEQWDAELAERRGEYYFAIGTTREGLTAWQRSIKPSNGAH